MFEKIISSSKISIFTVILVFMFAGPLTAATTGDLLHYYNLALKNDPQFRGAEYESLATREIMKQATAEFFPKMSGELSYLNTRQEIKNTENEVYAAGSTSYDTRNYGATIIQPIFHYSSYKSYLLAGSVLNRSALELEKARQDLALRVVEAYMDVLLNKDNLVAVKAEESAVELHHLRAKERSERGMAPITDRYDTEARLAAVRAQRVDAENVLYDALQALAEICGVSALEIKPLKDEIPLTPPVPEDVDRWTEAGMKQNLEILIQNLKVEIAGKEVERQKAAHYPTVDLQLDYNDKNTEGSLFGGGSHTVNRDIMLKLNMPIYEGGLVASKTREAANLHQSALQGAAKQNRATERKVRATYNGVVSAIARSLAMKKSIEAQMLVVEAKEEGFKAGLYISLAVLDAMQDLYRYKKEYSNARNDYILNSFRLKHAVGTLNLDELVLVNAWLQD